MSAIPSDQWSGRSIQFRHQYDEIRQRLAPSGIRCPHCQGTQEIYFSSAQSRRPLHKRAVFVYLRCHACTHRFRRWRLTPLLFWSSAALVALLAGAIL